MKAIIGRISWISTSGSAINRSKSVLNLFYLRVDGVGLLTRRCCMAWINVSIDGDVQFCS